MIDADKSGRDRLRRSVSWCEVGLVEAYSNKSAEAAHLWKLAQTKPSRSADDRSRIVPRKARQLTDTEKGHFVERYLEGTLIADLATELGVHRTTLDNLVIRLQLKRTDPRAVPANVVTATVRSYRAGKTLAELGIELDFSANKVQRMLGAAGEPIRPRGPKSEPLTSQQNNEIVALYESGRSIAAITGQLGVSYAAVRKHLIRADVQRRPRGGSHP